MEKKGMKQLLYNAKYKLRTIMTDIKASTLSDDEMTQLLSRPCKSYGSWLAALPREAAPGLAEECSRYIRYWGKGGGDYSTEVCVDEAIEDAQSDIPGVLAEAIRESVSGYSKTDFEASILAMNMIDDGLLELQDEDTGEDGNTPVDAVYVPGGNGEEEL